jgi:hypothetical protein
MAHLGAAGLGVVYPAGSVAELNKSLGGILGLSNLSVFLHVNAMTLSHPSWLISLVRDFPVAEGVEDVLFVGGDLGGEGLSRGVDRDGG